MYDFRADIEQYLSRLSDVIRLLNRDQINSAMNVIMETYEKEGRIFVFGNGGSASIASHFTCDFNNGVSLGMMKRFNFVCLNDNTPTMLAIANDHGYENIFVFQLENRLCKDDVILAVSGSGNSDNVIKAAEYAKKKGNKVIALTGYDGGELLKIADYPIHVNIDDMQKSEDMYIVLDHMMSQIIAAKLGKKMC